MKRMIIRVQWFAWKYPRPMWRIRTGTSMYTDWWTRRKSEAIQRARTIARLQWEWGDQLTQVVVYDTEGKIQTEWTYGKDPKRRKG